MVGGRAGEYFLYLLCGEADVAEVEFAAADEVGEQHPTVVCNLLLVLVQQCPHAFGELDESALSLHESPFVLVAEHELCVFAGAFEDQVET